MLLGYLPHGEEGIPVLGGVRVHFAFQTVTHPVSLVIPTCGGDLFDSELVLLAIRNREGRDVLGGERHCTLRRSETMLWEDVRVGQLLLGGLILVDGKIRVNLGRNIAGQVCFDIRSSARLSHPGEVNRVVRRMVTPAVSHAHEEPKECEVAFTVTKRSNALDPGGVDRVHAHSGGIRDPDNGLGGRRLTILEGRPIFRPLHASYRAKGRIGESLGAEDDDRVAAEARHWVSGAVIGSLG
jgi:hypothetical protein